MRDTTSAALSVQLAAIRALTPAQRLRQAIDLSETARALAITGLRLRFADRSEQELVDVYTCLYRSCSDGTFSDQ